MLTILLHLAGIINWVLVWVLRNTILSNARKFITDAFDSNPAGYPRSIGEVPHRVRKALLQKFAAKSHGNARPTSGPPITIFWDLPHDAKNYICDVMFLSDIAGLRELVNGLWLSDDQLRGVYIPDAWKPELLNANWKAIDTFLRTKKPLEPARFFNLPFPVNTPRDKLAKANLFPLDIVAYHDACKEKGLNNWDVEAWKEMEFMELHIWHRYQEKKAKMRRVLQGLELTEEERKNCRSYSAAAQLEAGK